MILNIVLGLVVVLVVFLVFVAQRPSHFHIERSAAIAAPASAVFPHVNASRGWEAWSPWLKMDPHAAHIYEGAAAGVGAVTRFAGRKVGEGSCTVVESRASELIRFRLDMIKPFKGSNDVVFTFIPKGDRTVVTWGMSGERHFMIKLFSLFMDCDDMCGRQFATGLATLKQLVETETTRRSLAPSPAAG